MQCLNIHPSCCRNTGARRRSTGRSSEEKQRLVSPLYWWMKEWIPATFSCSRKRHWRRRNVWRVAWPLANSARPCLSRHRAGGCRNRTETTARFTGITFARAWKKKLENQLKDNVFNIVNLIRGLSPSPAAYTHLEGQVLKIFSAEANQSKTSVAPGTIGSSSAAGLP